MAKIDKREVKLKKTNKRKIKEILEADSPTSKFKKLGNMNIASFIFKYSCVLIDTLMHLSRYFNSQNEVKEEDSSEN